MADQTRKQSLTNELQAARAQIADFVGVVREDLNVGARLRSNYSRNPAAWFGAASVLGLLLSGILVPRPKAVVKLPKGWNQAAEKTGKFGVVLAVFKLIFSIAQPAVVSFFRKKIESRTSVEAPKR